MQAKHPNAYLALAILYAQKNKSGQALAALDQLSAKPHPFAVRSAPIYDEARRVYRRANERMAERSFGAAMAFVEERRKTLTEQTGYPIEFVEEKRLPVHALTEIAWRCKRRAHRIKHRRSTTVILPHLLARELEHIALEDQARRSGKSKALGTTPQARRVFKKAVGNHPAKLRRLEFDPEEINEVMENFFRGVVENLYDTPLDMIVEYRLHQNAAPIRANQFVSLQTRQADHVEWIIEIGVEEIAPSCVYQANAALACAYALFTYWLYGGKTDYASAYRSLKAFATGKKLFETWQKAMPTLQPEDEYALVDTFAHILKSEGWYTWRTDRSEIPGESMRRK